MPRSACASPTSNRLNLLQIELLKRYRAGEKDVADPRRHPALDQRDRDCASQFGVMS